MTANDNPLVSVLMPVYNTGIYLRHAIETILHQSYEEWELLILNDASTDNSAEICESYTSDQRISFTSNESNQGYLNSINKLFKLAKGDLITFMDSDDLCTPDRLEKQVSFLKNHVEVGVVGTNFQIVDKKGIFIRACTKPDTSDAIDQKKRDENPFCGATMMIRRTVFESVGGYRLFFSGKSNEDYDWALRLLDVTRGANIQEELYQYRMLPISDSRNFRNTSKLLSAQIVQELARQRFENGQDWIDQGNEAALKTYEDTLLEPYVKDPSRSYREWASKLMYNKNFGQAIRSAFEAVKVRPFMLVNWRTWLYCVRKSLI